MATETYSVLGQSAPTGTTETTLYTVPAVSSAVVSTLTICNFTASTAHADVNVRPAGASVVNAHAFMRNCAIDPYSTVTFTIGFTLATTDVISVKTDTASALAFAVYGAVIA